MATRQDNQEAIIKILVNMAKEHKAEPKNIAIASLESFILDNKLATKNKAAILAVYCYNESKEEPLTVENAHLVETVVNINHPEYGNKRFNYNEQKLTEGYCSTIGTGSNSRVLFEDDYQYYNVVAFKAQ